MLSFNKAENIKSQRDSLPKSSAKITSIPPQSKMIAKSINNFYS